ncbi:hypothetical protein, partial [Nocardiopsis nanhaiensis]
GAAWGLRSVRGVGAALAALRARWRVPGVLSWRGGALRRLRAGAARKRGALGPGSVHGRAGRLLRVRCGRLTLRLGGW